MNEELRAYIKLVKQGFLNDPADSDFQRGYLRAIIELEEFFKGAN